jgi:hypothetical protein
MDFLDPEENLEQEQSPIFQPCVGDGLMKLKTNSPDNPIYIWRVILTGKDIKKVWPGKIQGDCKHNDLYWAIDFNKKLITLCNECDDFAYGHKVEENE